MTRRPYLSALFLLALLGCSATGGTLLQRRGELFSTPEAAVEQFKAAFNSEDPNQLIEIYGEEGRDFIMTGDAVADRAAMRRVSRRLHERAELLPLVVPDYPGEQWYRLRFGKEGWDMRIPLTNRGDGWYWATHHNGEALKQTRIAINEMTAIQTLLELHAAQRQYVAGDHDGDGVKEYAQRIISTEGNRDGLYWPGIRGDELSPLHTLVTEAVADGYASDGTAKSYEGYVYRVLKGQGRNARRGALSYMKGDNMTEGFAILAYPKIWDRSGLNSYIIDARGMLYKADLGFRSTKRAESMDLLDPDLHWTTVDRAYYGEDDKPGFLSPSHG